MTAIAPEMESLGLISAGERFQLTPLPGGVSSDIFKVEVDGRTFVIKRALAKLRVADDWQAPTSRNRHEADWLEVAARIVPGAVPRILARDDEQGLFAMEYCDRPVWKERLRQGDVDLDLAAAVGRTLAAIHANTAHDPAIAGRFATGDIFHAIRLEPYLETAARRHPQVAGPLMALSAQTLATRIALVHGDVSPKNILLGPLFLDAECAWFGDPAFDLAFCLNHLLLKCLWNRPAAPRFLAAFDRLATSYRAGVTWEPAEALDHRTARLLAALLLARVDGKSPVEYLDDAGRDFVRQFSLPLIAAPVATPDEIARRWAARLRL